MQGISSKVGAAAFANAVLVVGVYVAQQLGFQELPNEIVAASTTILTAVVGWAVKETATNA